MKVIFLDIDGVFNNTYSLSRANGHTRIERGKLQRLMPIVENTGAKIVLISSWKNYRDSKDESDKSNWNHLTRRFNRYGMEVFDITPDLPDKQRGAEILTWLVEHEDIEGFVIIDDVMFSDYHDPRLIDHVYLVRKDNEKHDGLQHTDIQPITRILEKNER